MLANLSGQMQKVDLSSYCDLHLTHDLLTDRPVPEVTFQLRPYQVAWLAGHRR